MRVALMLEASRDAAPALEESLSRRGHRVLRTTDAAHPELASVDLVVADTEVVASTNLVAKLTEVTPGIEFVLVGASRAPERDVPDVIEQLERPVDRERVLAIADELATVLDGERLREPIDLVAYETLFAGDSPAIRDLLRHVRLVARSDAPVWIFADDGSGRSIIARAIHDRSPRRGKPFVAFNCAAYSDDELSRRLFEGDEAAIGTARDGSVFIERIAMAGPHTQRAFLHFLETRRESSSARLIVGIHRDKLQDGPESFVSDLFYRLKVLEVDVPPLKERVRDLEQIVGRMLERLAPHAKNKTVSAEALRVLAKYQFPGNLMELAHALTHAFVLARGGSIEAQHLPIKIRQATADPDVARIIEGELEELDVVAKRFERDYLLRVLRSVDGNRGRAAEILGLSRKGLWGKLKAHGISNDDIDETADEVAD